MSLTPGRWARMSDPAKYRAYTRATLLGVVALVGGLAAANAVEYPQVAVPVVVAMIAAVLALESRPELTGRDRPQLDRILSVSAATAFVACWFVAVLQRRGDDDGPARAVAWFVLILASMSLIAFLDRRWLVLTVAVAATVAVFGGPSGPESAPPLVGVALFCIGTTRMSLWALRIVDDLDAARRSQAELKVAEERLRFARDLHDVVGRGFSTIAVKSELASRLVRAGAADRAAAEMDDVKALAVSSLEEMRSLVRGYRGIDLSGEVAGARSLLAAAGCELTIDGSPDDMPARLHEAAAWVVREGTTNIVRHSSATTATLTLTADGMTLTNDGAGDPMRAESGLRGLAERLSEVGGHLNATAAGDSFILDIRWETA